MIDPIIDNEFDVPLVRAITQLSELLRQQHLDSMAAQQRLTEAIEKSTHDRNVAAVEMASQLESIVAGLGLVQDALQDLKPAEPSGEDLYNSRKDRRY